MGNTNNFNIENNSNNANNANTIMLPLGRRRRRRRRREIWKKSLVFLRELIEQGDTEVLTKVATILASPQLQCAGHKEFERRKNQTSFSLLASSQLSTLRDYSCKTAK